MNAMRLVLCVWYDEHALRKAVKRVVSAPAATPKKAARKSK
jgi:hypothetical protein